MYMVVNYPTKEYTLQEDNSADLFNTNIAIDRNGKLVARYRKYNLYGETKFTQTDEPDVSYFKTDFGLTIGVFICFDINYKYPAEHLKELGIDTVAFSSAWYDELPFLTGK